MSKPGVVCCPCDGDAVISNAAKASAAVWTIADLSLNLTKTMDCLLERCVSVWRCIHRVGHLWSHGDGTIYAIV